MWEIDRRTDGYRNRQPTIVVKDRTYRSKEPKETSANILLVPNYCTIRVLWLHLLKTKLLNDKVLIQESGNVICPSLLQVNCESLVWVLILNLFMLLLMIQVEEFEKSFIGWAWFIIITITGKPYDWNLHKVLTTYSYCLPLTWISCS